MSITQNPYIGSWCPLDMLLWPLIPNFFVLWTSSGNTTNQRYNTTNQGDNILWRHNVIISNAILSYLILSLSIVLVKLRNSHLVGCNLRFRALFCSLSLGSPLHHEGQVDVVPVLQLDPLLSSCGKSSYHLNAGFAHLVSDGERAFPQWPQLLWMPDPPESLSRLLCCGLDKSGLLPVVSCLYWFSVNLCPDVVQ